MGTRPEYEVRITPHAERDLDRLSSTAYLRLDRQIGLLSREPRPRGVVKLQDKAHRIRVGPWRVIYVVDDARRVVVITAVRRREKDTYR